MDTQELYELLSKQLTEIDARFTKQLNEVETRLTTQINEVDAKHIKQFESLDAQLRNVEVDVAEIKSPIGTLCL